jgi:hypothetical protein
MLVGGMKVAILNKCEANMTRLADTHDNDPIGFLFFWLSHKKYFSFLRGGRGEGAR